MAQPDPKLLARITRLTGQRPVQVRTVQRGYTPATRLVITLADNSTCFAKVATTDYIAPWLRQEYYIYQNLAGTFMPRCLGWDDDGREPILLLEDLSGAFWPPPWNEELIEAVLEALAAISTTTIAGLPSITADQSLLAGWQRVAEDPQPFLALGLVSSSWLEAALPTLLGLDIAAAIEGETLLHLDVRSDNICLVGRRAMLIDWNHACLGHPHVDVGGWLASLAAEGGPPPQSILPDAAEIAAMMSGYFASKAGLPIIPEAPHVRQIQYVQLKTALPWVIRALDLPPADGPGWSVEE